MIRARRLELTGRVQGCGMRPALARLASHWQLSGWVSNVGDRVRLHVQGEQPALNSFCDAIASHLPPGALLRGLTVTERPVCSGLTTFSIREGKQAFGDSLPDLPSDTGICAACSAELRDPSLRRFAYPFTACTHCGPRLAVLRRWPFSRQNSSFSRFEACPACVAESQEPSNRRFGEELISCPACGPLLSWIDRRATSRSGSGPGDALARAGERLRQGRVIAVKGMTGFHLLCRADHGGAISTLRWLKARPAKPLAILVRDVSHARTIAEVSGSAAAWLESPSRPIVLLPRRWQDEGDLLAPGLDRWGIMLPTTALQTLLVDAVGVPLVATSANRRGEPVAASAEVLMDWLDEGLDGIVDHDIEILLPQDDSVLALDGDFPVWLRRSRGRLETLPLPGRLDATVRGEGAWNKNVMAWGCGDRIIAGPPTGDRSGWLAEQRRTHVANHLPSLLGAVPTRHVSEWHPDAPTSAEALPLFHHRAHLAALLLDAGMPQTPAMVACWDGLGAGEDGSWWGSSCFLNVGQGWLAAIRLLSFPMPGGDACQREPWRVAAACLVLSGIPAEAVSEWLAGMDEGLPARWALLRAGSPSSPECSSLGRFFEAMACIILQRPVNQHEGDIASRLEATARRAAESPCPLPVPARLDNVEPVQWDWRPLVRALWQGRQQAAGALAHGFHLALAEMLVADAVRDGVRTIGVTGGCFQNVMLLHEVRKRAEDAGLDWFSHRLLPPNDEALAWGQVALAAGLGRDTPVDGGE